METFRFWPPREDFREIMLLLLAACPVASCVTKLFPLESSPSTKSWERKYYKRQRVLFTWKVARWLIESLGHEVRAFFLSVVWPWASHSACLCLGFLIYQVIAMIHILSEDAVKSKIRSFYGKVLFNSKNMPKLIKLMFSIT